MAIESVYQNKQEEGLFVKGKKLLLFSVAFGNRWISMRLPASQNCYELHPAFDSFFDEGDNVDCDEVSLGFFEHGGDGEDGEGIHHGRGRVQ